VRLAIKICDLNITKIISTFTKANNINIIILFKLGIYLKKI